KAARGTGRQGGVGNRLGRRPAGCHGGSRRDRKSTRLNFSHDQISYAVFCLKKKKGWEFGSPMVSPSFLAASLSAVSAETRVKLMPICRQRDRSISAAASCTRSLPRTACATT